jgi:hypothetical protein
VLNILGRDIGMCDGLSRRAFLKIGGLAMGGLSLPQMLRAEQETGTNGFGKGIIMVFLPGGPPHQDMWDIKVDAPQDIKGPFNPIQTKVPGIDICEHFPRIASIADKMAFVRTVVGANGDHYAFQCLTGHDSRNQPAGGWPAMGSVLSKVYGSKRRDMPAYVGLSPKMGHMPWADNGKPGFLGVSHAPFTPHGDGKDNMVLQGLTLDRLADRRNVLSSLDTFRRGADSSGMMDGLDSFNQQAFGILTSSRLAEALDVEKEDPKLRDRYGRGFNQLKDDGGPRLLDNFLIARRLIEAGVRCVSLSFSRWDWHGNNFGQGREEMPMLDQAVSALVEDLEHRGLFNDVTVVVWGEFGRTPKINKDGGRDHWPQVSCALLAGGGIRGGQVVGETNRLGEHPEKRPVHFGEIFATLYKTQGIDIDRVTVNDLQGRPRYLIDQNLYRPMPELV